jgi:hypothetical protein
VGRKKMKGRNSRSARKKGRVHLALLFGVY